MDTNLVGTSYLYNHGFEEDNMFGRKNFTTFRTKYSNFGYVEDLSADPELNT